MAKKGRLKLERPLKAYALDQCALYKIKGIGQLLKVLLWNGTEDELEQFLNNESNYNVFLHKKTNRLIQHPKPRLDKLQSRIAVLLRRVAPPNYRHSGVRNRSFLTNASQHSRPGPAVKVDLEKFYPSTKFIHVYAFFRGKMHCSADVARLLTRICCYRDAHLPTGARHSEVLAFYCHKDIFDKIHHRATARNGVMSTYIDDIMLTMNSASDGDLKWIRGLFSKYGLKINSKKSRVYKASQPKVITGVVHSRGRQLAPHKQHRKAGEHFAALASLTQESTEYSAHARSLMGHLDHIALIDKRFKLRAVGNRLRLRKSII